MISINGKAMQRTLRDANRAALGCPWVREISTAGALWPFAIAHRERERQLSY